MNVETFINDGYIARSNHWISEEMKGIGKYDDEPYPFAFDNSSTHIRYNAGVKWFEETRKSGIIHIEDMFQYFGDTSAYQMGYDYGISAGLPSERVGTGTTFVIQPKKLIHWFT